MALPLPHLHSYPTSLDSSFNDGACVRDQALTAPPHEPLTAHSSFLLNDHTTSERPHVLHQAYLDEHRQHDTVPLPQSGLRIASFDHPSECALQHSRNARVGSQAVQEAPYCGPRQQPPPPRRPNFHTSLFPPTPELPPHHSDAAQTRDRTLPEAAGEAEAGYLVPPPGPRSPVPFPGIQFFASRPLSGGNPRTDPFPHTFGSGACENQLHKSSAPSMVPRSFPDPMPRLFDPTHRANFSESMHGPSLLGPSLGHDAHTGPPASAAPPSFPPAVQKEPPRRREAEGPVTGSNDSLRSGSNHILDPISLQHSNSQDEGDPEPTGRRRTKARRKTGVKKAKTGPQSLRTPSARPAAKVTKQRISATSKLT
ncbi:hypothetical protein FH972_024087 [Carpinus fangiana]|uniref:Uncharacterized protein n=1 Tax=Carpinus fangiana TaxID=176857 RepID=A0A5N6KX07_9ROSI|nr:hypothetical protein FH972_024087 [Carpinus fangiana]